MNIYDLISRAQKLRKETQLDSVSPDRVGGLHEDTLKYINEFQLLASSPSLHKIYASVSAMQSDKSPKSDLTGKPLKPGQLVVIVPANQTDATAGDVYRYDGPSGNTSAWTFVAKIGAVPADAELSATSTNPPQNKVVTEKLTELESEIGNFSSDAKITTSDEISAEIEYDSKYVDFASGGGTANYAPYAISKPISLKKYEKIIVKAAGNDVVSIISKKKENGGYVALVQGSIDYKRFESSWVADEDCEVVISYLKSLGAAYAISKTGYDEKLADAESSTKAQKDRIDALESKVFVKGAILNTNLPNVDKNLILGAIKDIQIGGFDKSQQLIVSRVRYIAAAVEYNSFSVEISLIENSELKEVCFFRVSVTEENKGIHTLNASTVTHKDCYEAMMVVDTSALGVYLFDSGAITSVSSETYKMFGLSSSCLYDDDYVTIVEPTAPKRISRALRCATISNLDTTRNYRLKTLSYDGNSGLLSIGFCTDENLQVSGMLFQKTIPPTDAVGVRNISFSGDSVFTLDFNVLNSNHKYFVNETDVNHAYGVVLIPTTPCVNLSAGEEMALTYNGSPMRLLDCGKVSGLFYLACGRKIFSTPHIVKSAYTENDLSLTLVYEFGDEVNRDQTVYERIDAIFGIRELNTGNLLVNVCVQTSNTEDFSNINPDGEGVSKADQYGRFYMIEKGAARYLFDGVWFGALLSGGWTKRGGMSTFVWDFSEYENYIFVAERGGQGTSGRAWMSNDYGKTWYVIFNAYPDTGWIYSNPPYPFRNPVGFDTEHGDFDSTQANGRKFFHIHGIAYDHWRNQVIITSGDATWVQGSYTAVWVWKSPQNIELYPEQTYEGGYSGTEVYPLGGTKADNPVKMLKNTWKRVGLHQDDNTGMIGNMQFVGCIPFKEVIAFTTDCNVQGGNGIIYNAYPDNIVSENFRIGYALSADSEKNTLTHCGGGYMFVGNLCLATIHRENDNNIPSDSERGGAVLASTNGMVWKRVFVDDTIDADKNTKIYWGATMIGKPTELYLRYKGFRLEDNIIRQMRLE